MIRRIQLLRNIGQFDSVDAGSNIHLARVNVVYSENGRGKTTIAAVLRSLSNGDPVPISERRRLTAQHQPHIVLDCAGGPSAAIFENGSWNRTLNDVVVFDDIFIDQNIHSGLSVESHHRQNLHELILGAEAVALNQRLQRLVAQVEAHNRELRNRAGEITAADRGPFSVDDFCALPVRPDINDAIQDVERALAAGREQEPIRTTTGFDALNLPGFDLEAVERILRQNLPALDTATLSRVQNHLANLGRGGETWIAEGMRINPAGNNECPFCLQDLQASPVLAHYRTYFSDEYSNLKRAVADSIQAVSRIHGGEVPAGFERAFRGAIEKRQFWMRFCEVPEFTLDTAAIVRDWRAARDAVVGQLSAKQAAPLEHFELADATRTLVAAYETHRATVAELNQRLSATNVSIAAVKERTATANTATLSADLGRLTAVRARHSGENVAKCEAYIGERTSKEATERERDQVRAQLEQHRTNVFPRYQTAINLYLARLNAEFRLDQVTHANTRGGPVATYNVLINNRPVTVGAATIAPGQPSFKSTLSAGDRNTLALAFFFASLEQDANLANRVVVIDDPISSLDDHRTLATAQEIRRLVGRAAQVIVLSHNKPFLCRLWEGIDATIGAAVEVIRDGQGSTLRSWDVSRDSITEHDRRHQVLSLYLSEGAGEQREIARSIRPHIEAYLRVARPGAFPPGTLLGNFRNQCRQSLGQPTQIFDQNTLQDLEEIVEYANGFHHDTNAAWETQAINDGELRGVVNRAMAFVRR